MHQKLKVKKDNCALLITCTWFAKKWYLVLPTKKDPKAFMRDLKKLCKPLVPAVPAKMLALLSS